MRLHLPLCLCLLSVAGAFASCGNKNARGNGQSQAIESFDSLPASVRDLIKAVRSDNPSAFAALVSYPLERPYPLKDIQDSAAMVAYYPTLMDRKLRSAIGDSAPDEWSEFGWRGWSLDDGEYVWVDESVYAVDNLSDAEKALRESLVKQELESLPEAMREDWQPVSCVKDLENGNVMRIDSKEDADGEEIYRLALYTPGTSLRGNPSQLFTGYRELEGSAMTESYVFTGPSDYSITYMPFHPGQDGGAVIYRPAGSQTDEHPTEAVYWLDLISK